MVGIENLSRRLAQAEKQRRALRAAERAAQEAAAAATSEESAPGAQNPETTLPVSSERPAAPALNFAAIGRALFLPRLDRLLLLLIVSFLAGMLLAHFATA